MSYSFVANMAVSVKEKQSIQLAYWADILAKGIMTLVEKKQRIPKCLIEGADKFRNYGPTK